MTRSTGLAVSPRAIAAAPMTESRRRMKGPRRSTKVNANRAQSNPRPTMASASLLPEHAAEESARTPTPKSTRRRRCRRARERIRRETRCELGDVSFAVTIAPLVTAVNGASANGLPSEFGQRSGQLPRVRVEERPACGLQPAVAIHLHLDAHTNIAP